MHCSTLVLFTFGAAALAHPQHSLFHRNPEALKARSPVPGRWRGSSFDIVGGKLKKGHKALASKWGKSNWGDTAEDGHIITMDDVMVSPDSDDSDDADTVPEVQAAVEPAPVPAPAPAPAPSPEEDPEPVTAEAVTPPPPAAPETSEAAPAPQPTQAPPVESPTPPPAPTDNSGSDSSTGPTEFAQEALDEHNKFRAEHGASPLTWDGSLAASAQSLASSCNFAHDRSGQNLAGGTSMKASVDMWMSEGYSGTLNHYTQVIWKGSKQVGCATASCPNVAGGSMTVCNYSPAGNMIGAEAANIS